MSWRPWLYVIVTPKPLLSPGADITSGTLIRKMPPVFQAAEKSEFQAVVVWFTPAMQYFKLPVCDSNYIAYKILLKNHFMNDKTFTQGMLT